MQQGFDSNTHVFPLHRKCNTLSFIDLAICLIDIGIGTGVTKLGSTFNNGWLTATIVSTVLALITAFSLYIEILAFAKVKEGSFDGCCFILFGRVTATILSLISIISEFVVVYFYMIFCQSSVKAIILKISPNANEIFIQPLFVNVIIFCVIFIPLTIPTDASFFKHVTRIKFIIILFLVCAVIYLFVKKVQNEGFDPNNEMKMTTPGYSSITACVSTYATAYLIQPISFPSVGNIQNPTWPRLVALIFVVIGMQWLINEALGLLEYFTLYGRNKGDVFFNYFDSSFAYIANIALCAMMILSNVILTYPIRNVIIHACVPSRKDREKSMWSFFAIVLYIIFMYLTQISLDSLTNIFSLLLDVFSPFIMYTEPAIIYLKANGKSSMFLFVSSIILAVFGVALSVFFFVKFFVTF